jgi:C4-dicarboxylate-binding protein DctP
MIASKDVPVHTPADMKGRRVLVTSGGFGEQVEAFGGIPVTVAMGDIYVGLQRGMGEMFICGVSCVKGARVQEFCKYSVALGQTSISAFPYNINRELFEEDMTEEQRKLTMELSKGLGEKVVASFLRDVEDTYKQFREAGMEVYFPNDAEMAQWKEAVMSLLPSKIEKAQKAGVKNAEEIVKKYYEIAATVE